VHRRADRINMVTLKRTRSARVLTGSPIGILLPTRRRCTCETGHPRCRTARSESRWPDAARNDERG
jgi:hypothetical protein